MTNFTRTKLAAVAAAIGILTLGGFYLFGQEPEPLHEALEHRKYDEAIQLARLATDLNARDAAGALPLVLAADDPTADAYDMVRELILRGAMVNEADGKGYTPLHRAVHHGNLAVVDLLLKNGADINASRDYEAVLGKETETPLEIAYKRGHSRVAEFLEERGAEIPDKLETLKELGEIKKLSDFYAKYPKPPNYTEDEWDREVQHRIMRKVNPEIAKFMAAFEGMNPEAMQLIGNILERPAPEGVDEILWQRQLMGEVHQLFNSGQFEIPDLKD